MYRTILVPLDGSPFGEAALPLALNLAHKAGAMLQLVHVMPPLGTIYSEAPLYMDSALEQELYEHQKASHQEYLTRVARQLGDAAPVVVKTSLLSGDIPSQVQAQASQTRADLVVMTTHGRGPMGASGWAASRMSWCVSCRCRCCWSGQTRPWPATSRSRCCGTS